MRIEYFLVLFCIVAGPLVLSRDPKLGLSRQRPSLLKAIVVVCLIFWTWDVVATARGHWSFNPAYTIGLTVLGLPVEEWLFFLVVSFVSIFTWESTKYFFRKR